MEFGSWQGKELSSALEDLLFGYPVDVTSGKGYVEVKLKGVNKGVAVQLILEQIQKVKGDVDFVLCTIFNSFNILCVIMHSFY